MATATIRLKADYQLPALEPAHTATTASAATLSGVLPWSAARGEEPRWGQLLDVDFRSAAGWDDAAEVLPLAYERPVIESWELAFRTADLPAKRPVIWVDPNEP